MATDPKIYKAAKDEAEKLEKIHRPTFTRAEYNCFRWGFEKGVKWEREQKEKAYRRTLGLEET